MTWIFVLLLLAATLISFEIIIPSSIRSSRPCAYLAACIYAGVTLVFSRLSTLFCWRYLFGVLLYFEFKLIPHTWLGRQLFLSKEVDGKGNSGIPEDLLGKNGETQHRCVPPV